MTKTASRNCAPEHAGGAHFADDGVVPAGLLDALPTPKITCRSLQMVDEYQRQQLSAINLVASENQMSPAARHALASDLAHRYLIPPIDKRPPEIWDYPNQRIPRELEAHVLALACKLFHGEVADVRPLSGNNVAGIILNAAASRGAAAFTVPASAGGHFSSPVLCEELGIDRHDLPYSPATGRIDLESCAAMAKEINPALVYLDASMVLFPYPLAELRAIFGANCPIVYDASHCFGLIAGKSFQSPLEEGADLIVGSTHKSMFGPQKGMIVGRHESAPFYQKVRDIITPNFVSNAHVHHIAALGIALEELEAFGVEYAQQTIANAKALGRELTRYGFDVLYPEQDFTESHQIIVKIGCYGSTMAAMEKLERCGIRVNGVKIPFSQDYGLRIGLSEVTRRGLDEQTVSWIAGLVYGAISGVHRLSVIAQDVKAISRNHSSLKYGFDRHGIALDER